MKSVDFRLLSCSVSRIRLCPMEVNQYMFICLQVSSVMGDVFGSRALYQ